jgi:hypothetical protein
MDTHHDEVHVYATGRGFVVVPVVRRADDENAEWTPVRRVSLALGRPTVVTLSRALQKAREQSAAGPEAGTEAWDGDGGRWWVRHLLLVEITWQAEQIKLTHETRAHGGLLAREPVQTLSLPGDTPAYDLARWIVQYLAETLHTS